MSFSAEIVVRNGERGDAAGLSKVGARLFRQTYQGKMPSIDLESYVAEDFNLEQQLAELQDPNVTTLLVEKAGEIVGYAQVRQNPIPASTGLNVAIELWRIYLERSSQGLGIGKLLLSRAGEAVRSRSEDQVWLGVWERNLGAISFYEKHGFHIAGSQKFNIGAEVHNDLVMVGSAGAF